MDVSLMEPPEASPRAEPRLMISKIVCDNFKSYAGVKELGPFHKVKYGFGGGEALGARLQKRCFTSIVGPNGSGKSNVIDAMLFVFGYRARKIRSKKISVLIHNSDHHQNISSCTVSVHFQKIIDLPGDDFQVVPNTQFVVSRTAFTDNSSYYQLNGKRLPFKEVASLLRESGIDLDHNRFLILQGEVEQIALMKPKAQSENDDGMLEFLEDIIGTSRFKEPIEELAKKVEELNECRGEKLNRAKAVEKEKLDLEGAKDEAEQYLEMQKEVAMRQHTLYQRYIQHEAKAREKKEELDSQANQLQATLNEHAAAKKDKLKAQKKDYKVYERLTSQHEECKEKIASCEQRDVRARQDLKNSKASLKKMAKSLEKEREKLSELEAAPGKHQKEIQEMEKKLRILESRKKQEEEKLVEVMEGLKTATQGLQAEKEEHELKLVDLNQTVNEAKSQLEVAQAEVDIYCERFCSGERQLNEAKQNLQDIQATLLEKKKELASLEKSLPGKRRGLSEADSELRVVGEAGERLGQQVRACRTQVEEARSSLQAHRSRGRVLDALMQQKASGAIPGIHGRLGDLGAIDEKYDVAISTACGALDHIVVDSMETAVKCVEFLKKNSIGQGTFIGLDKVEQWRKHTTSKPSTPENVPRLFDLVKAKDERFLTAFYFSLRETLVAKDLDQATRIGLQGQKRFRVVTLGGQLIDASGTMSGGGNRVMKGRMSSTLHSDISPRQLEEIEKKLESDEKALQECSQRRLDLEGQVKTLKAEIAEEEKQMKKKSRDIQLLGEQEKALRERIRDLEVANAENKMEPAHLDRLKEQVQQFQKVYQKADDAASKVQAEVQRLHDRIMEVGGSRVQQQQKQVDSVCRDIDQTSGAITKANVAIKTAERNTKKCRDKIPSLEKDLQDTETRIEELKGVLTHLEDEAREVIEKQEGIHVAMKQHEEVLTQLKAEIEAMEGEEGEVQGKMMDVKHELEKYTARMKENQQKIKYFQNDMCKLGLGDDVKELGEEELEALDKKSVEYEITVMEERLKQMTPNMAAIEEYRRKDEAHQTHLRELDAITTERDTKRSEFESFRKQRLDEFMAGFSTITNKLKEMYQMITLGGDAELELVDSLDPFSEGIVFSVRPPKKSWKNISNLSGGEKTLSSLALVFALHHYKPSPLYVMDEIDAALDFKNVSIVANYIKERTKNAQFIIISLRNNMFELADRLVGIYKTDNCTKSVTIDPNKLSQGIRPSIASEA